MYSEQNSKSNFLFNYFNIGIRKMQGKYNNWIRNQIIPTNITVLSK